MQSKIYYFWSQNCYEGIIGVSDIRGANEPLPSKYLAELKYENSPPPDTTRVPAPPPPSLTGPT